MKSSTATRWHERLNQPRDIAALAVFRIAFGLLMCVGSLRFISNGWIEHLFVEPQFHFKYWGFSWVVVPGATGLYLLYAAIAIAAFMVALGAFYRVAIISFWLLFTYAELMDVTTYLNHYYFVSLLALILCFLSPHRAWSVDAWRKPEQARNTLPAWQTWWLRFQVGLLYFYAGWAKFEPDWLLGAQPLNIWLPPHAGLPLIGPLLDEIWVHFAFSWFAFVFDVSIIGFMLWRRSRPVAFAVILVFHLFTHLFFNIGLFPFIMVLSVLVFFDANWPRWWIAKTQALFKRPAVESHRPLPAIAVPVNHWTLKQGLFATAVLAFCAVQFLLPLRQWVYPGTVLWHEQGMRFSWRVMLREKSGTLSYRVVDAQGRSQIVSPHAWLTEQQYREMSGQPDMILQLAHHIRDDFNASGLGPVAVFADSRVSLNGRAAAALIDPNVDLATIKDGLGRADWILPPPQSTPPLQRPLTLANR